MDPEEKRLRLQTIEIALQDINKIIDTMEKKSYPKEQLNEYYKKRWELWNEEFRTKKA
jgi:hypothetical protein